MAAKIGDDELELRVPGGYGCEPVLAGAGKSVEQKQWLAGSMDLKIKLDPVEGYYATVHSGVHGKRFDYLFVARVTCAVIRGL